jgi:inosine-uridine nucleoside N-ribohydrolase
VKRLILDTDPGVDDSMAILLALKSPEIKLEALTTIFGNGGVEQTTANALRVLELAGWSDIPVVAGAKKPLLREFDGSGWMVHGRDGLGETHMPPAKAQPQPGRAAEYLIARIMAEPGQLTLAAVGPLTNLALAVSVEPKIAQNVKEVIIMGGSAAEPGNVSPVAEANIHNDPEAANIVFHAGWPLTMVGLDVTHKTIMTPAYLARLEAIGNPVSDFISAIHPFYLRFHQEHGLDGFYVHDSSAIAYIIDPTLFKTQAYHVDVALADPNRGHTIADWRGVWQKPANVNVCLEVNSARFLDMYLERIAKN